MNDSKYYKTLDLLTEGVQIIDYDWRYLYVNNALLGYQKASKEEVIGRTILERYPDFEKTEAFQRLKVCMTERRSEQTESEFQYPDKTKKWFSLRIEPVEEGLLILSLDITAPICQNDQKQYQSS